VNNVPVTIAGLTIRGGAATTALGAGARSVGNLTLAGDLVTDNSAFEGGGVSSSGGTLTVRASTISHNHGDGNIGGGVLVPSNGGTASVTDSLIADNTAQEGGGMWIGNGSSAIVTGSSVDGNTGSANDGGGIYSKGDLTLTDVTVSGNKSGFGAGIENEAVSPAKATLTRVLVTRNSASGTVLKGGGVYNDGPMTIAESTVTGNTAGSTASGGSGLGGGVYNSSGTLAITQSTIAGNNALNGDGFFIATGQATLENVTITGNGQSSAQGRGGGIFSDGGTLALANATVAGNEASFAAGDGGNLYNASSVTAQNTITANALTSGNCGGAAPTSLGHNLTFDSNADTQPCFSPGGGNVFADPQLGPLQSNGGATQTMAIPQTSAALDAGAECPAVDQRGFGRPQGPACDIGAFELDYIPPQTTITSGPTGLRRSTSARFSFTSNEAGARFECSLDGAALKSCASPKSYAGLKQGSHTFRARAIDPSGNVDPSAAVRTFTVDTHAPDTTITAGPSGKTRGRTPTFKFRSSEAGSTFRCALDSGRYGSCTSPHKTSKLGFGAHVFHVRARDRAGNLDPTPSKRSFRVVH
jgi:predicted outer membrane repeat protein